MTDYKDEDWSYLDDEWSLLEAEKPLIYMENEYGFENAEEGDLTFCRFLFMPPPDSRFAFYTGRICAVLGRASVDDGMWYVIFGDGTRAAVSVDCFREARYIRKNTVIERDLTGLRRLFVPDSYAAKRGPEHAECLCTVERLSERYHSDLILPFTWNVRFDDGRLGLAQDNELFPVTPAKIDVET